MLTYYRTTLLALLVLFAAATLAAIAANSAAAAAGIRRTEVQGELAAATMRAAHGREQLETLRAAMQPVRQFSVAWKPSTDMGEKDAAERIRSEIEAIAQRQLGLVTDNAITPQPEKITVHGRTWRVQRVTLRASGKDISALLAWLGKVENRYPAAVLETCEFVSNVGGSTALTLRLMQPLAETDPRPAPIPAAVDPSALRETLATISWARYLPARVKTPVGVGFHRNPLQPAVPADASPVLRLGSAGDEYATKFETLLEGRIRSVVRGPSPLVVFDGKICRIGDELTPGRGRPSLLPDLRVKLKHVSDHTLLFHVTSSGGERPVSCDVSYILPAFLRAR